ncbi:pupal cuticle protein isoform X2 [Daphnia magna]|uniref:pupal cuticle protein isoform X2 n=1 Tax=Daphnia magna TaxID=35525 RepID=UPI001E1BDBA5|nr:pupal cuticle protein isoform X2 [Daphnia magna]XP_045032911.1 pupal cuticle protein isoform X2 [Daphnia magna]XP_045032912.1 pupal cuticle protein isoform X2 [Daphnia magna]
MQTSVAFSLVVLMACVVSAQFPAGWNYNPFLYYPYTAQQPPVQETPEVAAARATHLAIHALAKSQAVKPTPVSVHSAAISTTPNVWTAKAQHQGASSATASSAVVTNAGIPQQVQETAEVAAARRAHMAAHALAAARVVKGVPAQPLSTAFASQQLANSVAANTNAIVSSLPSFLPAVTWGPPQPVQDTPEVQAAKLAFFRAFREALARFG